MPDQTDHIRFVQHFVDALPDRLDAIRQMATARDSAALLGLLQELRDQAGKHGLASIRQYAERLEHTARVSADLKDLDIAIQDLAGLCQRIRTGQGTS